MISYAIPILRHGHVSPTRRHHHHSSRLSTAHSNSVKPGGDFTPTRISGRTDTRGIDRRAPTSAKSLHAAAHWNNCSKKANANSAVTSRTISSRLAHRLPSCNLLHVTLASSQERRQLINSGEPHDASRRGAENYFAN